MKIKKIKSAVYTTNGVMTSFLSGVLSRPAPSAPLPSPPVNNQANNVALFNLLGLSTMMLLAPINPAILFSIVVVATSLMLLSNLIVFALNKTQPKKFYTNTFTHFQSPRADHSETIHIYTQLNLTRKTS